MVYSPLIQLEWMSGFMDRMDFARWLIHRQGHGELSIRWSELFRGLQAAAVGGVGPVATDQFGRRFLTPIAAIYEKLARAPCPVHYLDVLEALSISRLAAAGFQAGHIFGLTDKTVFSGLKSPTAVEIVEALTPEGRRLDSAPNRCRIYRAGMLIGLNFAGWALRSDNDDRQNASRHRKDATVFREFSSVRNRVEVVLTRHAVPQIELNWSTEKDEEPWPIHRTSRWTS